MVMRKLSAILSVSILILMSFSSIIQDRDELSTLEVKSNAENIASGLFHLVDDVPHHQKQGINLMSLNFPCLFLISLFNHTHHILWNCSTITTTKYLYWYD